MKARNARLPVLAAAALAAATIPAATGAGPTRQAAPTLVVKPRAIVYGGPSVVLSGVVPSRRAGEVVTILSRPCRFTEAAAIGTVRTKKAGVFRYAVQPMLNTAFSVRVNRARSRTVTVGVRPKVSLRRLGAGRYRIEVATTNGVFLDGRRVFLQRAVGRRWRNVAQATLEKASAETAITVLSAQTVAARVPSRSRLRAFLPQSQATCYRAAASGTTTG